RGNAVWGIPTLSPKLDDVMPTLRALRSRFAQGSFLETTTSTIEPLKFWTAAGTRTLACEIRTLDESVGPGLMLVVAGAATRPSSARREVVRREVPLKVAAARAKLAPAVREEPPERTRPPASPLRASSLPTSPP